MIVLCISYCARGSVLFFCRWQLVNVAYGGPCGFHAEDGLVDIILQTATINGSDEDDESQERRHAKGLGRDQAVKTLVTGIKARGFRTIFSRRRARHESKMLRYKNNINIVGGKLVVIFFNCFIRRVMMSSLITPLWRIAPLFGANTIKIVAPL